MSKEISFASTSEKPWLKWLLFAPEMLFVCTFFSCLFSLVSSYLTFNSQIPAFFSLLAFVIFQIFFILLVVSSILSFLSLGFKFTFFSFKGKNKMFNFLQLLFLLFLAFAVCQFFLSSIISLQEENFWKQRTTNLIFWGFVSLFLYLELQIYAFTTLKKNFPPLKEQA